MSLETSNKIDAQSFKREPPVPNPVLTVTSLPDTQRSCDREH